MVTPAGFVQVCGEPVNVKACAVGPLAVIENALSAVFPLEVALKVKLLVVDELTVGIVPVIAPVDVFKVNPDGKEPD